MVVKQFGRLIIEYFDLNSGTKRLIANTPPEDALVKVNELENRISALDEKRAGYTTLRKIVAYFNLNESSISSLREKRDFYQSIYNSKK